MSLRGKRVVVTRAAHQAESLSRLLRERGAEAVLLPTIEVTLLAGDALEAARASAALLIEGGYDALLLTSSNSARALSQLLRQQGFAGVIDCPIFAIGQATADAAAALGHTIITADKQVGEGLVAMVTAHLGALAGKRLLLPRSRIGREVIPALLAQQGAAVDAVPLYDTTVLADGPQLDTLGAIDWIIVASPSAVRGLHARGTLPAGCKIASIGPTTSSEARALGLTVSVEPAQQSMRALVAAIDSDGDA